jgi:tripartite-type tricarboxylate transporter receptor subunit TctC
MGKQELDNLVKIGKLKVEAASRKEFDGMLGSARRGLADAQNQTIPGYETSNWQGLGTPKNTPAEIIAKLNKEINAALADPKLKARLADLGGTVLPGSATDFGKLIAEETEKWGKVIRAAGIKAE